MAAAILARKQRDRMDEGGRRFYDPLADPVIGRDSPGQKYASLNVLGNE